ncbi:winged helix-turn-helix transcriptional regulator [Sulfurimonas sp. SAG-AH-194-L11]|nr:metalloregulator ArsR/SmtB family transcription factor [Sulfurimonas sp. SAG-AH-194-L11]MDF1877071.1 winged helix-turn-helix transcriptional regulator [Sulfurimonas sp. SAG-AH-194-L11]
MNNTLSCCRIEIDEDLIGSAKALLESDDNALMQKAKLFSLLGNDIRLKIVRLFLCYEKMCVCDLADVLAMKQSPISQHLRKLKDGEVLNSKRDGMTIFYSLQESKRETLSKIIEG